jgi:AraC family transcriptional regulator
VVSTYFRDCGVGQNIGLAPPFKNAQKCGSEAAPRRQRVVLARFEETPFCGERTAMRRASDLSKNATATWLEGLQGYDLIRSTRTVGMSEITIDEVQLRETESYLPGYRAHLLGVTIAGDYALTERIDGKEYTSQLSAGSISLVPAGISWYCRHSNHWSRSAAVWVPERLVLEACDEMFVESTGGVELLPSINSRDVAIEQLVAVMMGELRLPAHPAQHLIYEGASIALVAQIVRRFGSRVARARRTTGFLSRRALAAVTSYIDEHLHERIGLAELAGLAGVGRHHFIRLFRKSTGSSPMVYLERSRIARATELLRSRELRLSEIANRFFQLCCAILDVLRDVCSLRSSRGF